MPLDDRFPKPQPRDYDPIILAIDWTPELYRKVTISVRPGRRWSCIVGPRGASDDQAKQAALELLAHIKP